MSLPADRNQDRGIITAAALREWRLPDPSGTKHSRGRLAVVGGSASTPGAAMLAGVAGLRVGAGVLSLAVAASVAATVAVAVPEAAVSPLDVLDHSDALVDLGDTLDRCDALLAGPGIDEPEGARAVVEAILEHRDPKSALVLDAFALGVLPGLVGDGVLDERTVLTPNQAEAHRLLDDDVSTDADDENIAQTLAARYRAVTAFAGHVATPDGRTWTVSTGHPGLGTSGSGDVLAGAIAGLLARGADAEQAACWGTFLHAAAGDRLAARIGRLGFLARELADELPYVLVQTQA